MSFILNPMNSVIPIGGVATLTGNSGGAVGPSAGNINVVGAGDVLVTGNPGTNTLTVSVTGGIPETFDADSGSATSSGGIININGGTHVTTSASGNTVVINAVVPPNFTWNDVISGSQAAAVNNGYIIDNATIVTVTLPSVAPLGSVVRVSGGVIGVGGWTIVYGTGVTIHFGAIDTTTTTGSLSSTLQYDCVELLCTTANTDWVVQSVIGNLAWV